MLKNVSVCIWHIKYCCVMIRIEPHLAMINFCGHHISVVPSASVQIGGEGEGGEICVQTGTSTYPSLVSVSEIAAVKKWEGGHCK